MVPCFTPLVHTFNFFSSRSATLQPMSEPAQRSDVVLFNFIFGPSPYTMPTFPFFLQSAEYSGADDVDPADARSLRLLRARLLAGEAEAVRGPVRGREH